MPRTPKASKRTTDMFVTAGKTDMFGTAAKADLFGTAGKTDMLGTAGKTDMFYYKEWEFKDDESFKNARQRLAKGFSYCPEKGRWNISQVSFVPNLHYRLA